MAAPKSDGFEPVIITDDQYEALLTECKREDRPMLWLYTLLLGETGARAYSEALHIRWENVDFDGGFVKIVSGRDGHRTKSGKGRWVPMTGRLRKAMREHAARFRMVTYHGERTPWVFQTHARPAALHDRGAGQGLPAGVRQRRGAGEAPRRLPPPRPTPPPGHHVAGGGRIGRAGPRGDGALRPPHHHGIQAPRTGASADPGPPTWWEGPGSNRGGSSAPAGGFSKARSPSSSLAVRCASGG